jgi:hypothetical protein
MEINSIKYANPGATTLTVTTSEGQMSVPWPCRTWHREPIQDWLDAGNRITPYQRFDTLEQARSELIREVYAHAARLIDQATAGYAAGEMAAWTDLEREAAQYQADDTIGPLMQAEIDQGQRDAATLADIVLRKAEGLRQWRAAVIGARTKHAAAIQSAELTTLQTYDTGTGWPVRK